ncbi:LOW QUALITY PROTEIN: trihelix transcription factor GTL2-like [Primulina tabacum]|uniref:LOW QUALITY PROTEIN: trihelix transcription factor GTL2-like n=1 Tax=Primulina tabacum TaxID=48773 RepID=UPI003F5ACA11
MFNGVPSDEFHRFISSRNSSLPIPLHAFSDNFNPFSSPSPSSLQQFQRQESVVKNVGKQLQRDGSMDPWSADELLALLKVRSSMENWFPDMSWELVSRKLAGLGFARGAEQCKEKFEDESCNFNSLSYEKNYRIFNEFDPFYNSENQEKSHIVPETVKQINEGDKVQQIHVEELETEKFQESEEMVKKTEEKTRKRKRKDKFEMFEGFCEAIVSKMIAQQEELHNKLVEDLVRRDKEMAEREEVWKRQEMDRIKRENEIKAREQAIAGEREANIIGLLKKIQDLVKLNDTATGKLLQDFEFPKAQNKLETSSSPEMVESHKNPSSDIPLESKTEATKATPSPPSPSSSLATKNSEANSCSISVLTNEILTSHKFCQMMDSRGDIGKRWPRDEVLALIHLRCKFSGNIEEIKEGAKGPLWERISQGMMELGYKRNAKRCKEKWENINKYFRKTKDSTKKRSIDSRTCPYFHQLNSLYSGGTLENQSNVPENSEQTESTVHHHVRNV